MNIKDIDSSECSMLIIKEMNDYYQIDFMNGDGSKEIIYKINDCNNDKIINLVNDFLDTTTIDCIDITTIYFSSLFIGIKGYQNMYIYLKNKNLLQRLIKRIENKYNRDRYKYLINNSVQNNYIINLSVDETSYYENYIDCIDDSEKLKNNDIYSKFIQLNLVCNNGDVIDFDKNFIERFMYDKLWDIGVLANLEDSNNNLMDCFIGKYYITCRELVIIFNYDYKNKEYVYNLCSKVINKYNGELIENDKINKKQLKMEEF